MGWTSSFAVACFCLKAAVSCNNRLETPADLELLPVDSTGDVTFASDFAAPTGWVCLKVLVTRAARCGFSWGVVRVVAARASEEVADAGATEDGRTDDPGDAVVPVRATLLPEATGVRLELEGGVLRTGNLRFALPVGVEEAARGLCDCCVGALGRENPAAEAPDNGVRVGVVRVAEVRSEAGAGSVFVNSLDEAALVAEAVVGRERRSKTD